jgi:hypothetical protein
MTCHIRQSAHLIRHTWLQQIGCAAACATNAITRTPTQHSELAFLVALVAQHSKCALDRRRQRDHGTDERWRHTWRLRTAFAETRRRTGRAGRVIGVGREQQQHVELAAE